MRLKNYTEEKWKERFGPLMPLPNPEDPTDFQVRLWRHGSVPEVQIPNNGPSTRIQALRRLCQAVAPTIDFDNCPEASIWGDSPLLWLFQKTFGFHKKVMAAFRQWIDTKSESPLDRSSFLFLLILDLQLNQKIASSWETYQSQLPLSREGKAFLQAFIDAMPKELPISDDPDLSFAIQNNPNVKALKALFDLADNATVLEKCNLAIFFFFFLSKSTFEGRLMHRAALKIDASAAHFFKPLYEQPLEFWQASYKFEFGLPATTSEAKNQLVEMQEPLYTLLAQVYLDGFYYSELQKYNV